MQNIKQDIENDLRNYLSSMVGTNFTTKQVELACSIVSNHFENYPSPSKKNHADTNDDNRYTDKDVDVDMLHQMYNQII